MSLDIQLARLTTDPMRFKPRKASAPSLRVKEIRSGQRGTFIDVRIDTGRRDRYVNARNRLIKMRSRYNLVWVVAGMRWSNSAESQLAMADPLFRDNQDAILRLVLAVDPTQA